MAISWKRLFRGAGSQPRGHETLLVSLPKGFGRGWAEVSAADFIAQYGGGGGGTPPLELVTDTENGVVGLTTSDDTYQVTVYWTDPDTQNQFGLTVQTQTQLLARDLLSLAAQGAFDPRITVDGTGGGIVLQADGEGGAAIIDAVSGFQWQVDPTTYGPPNEANSKQNRVTLPVGWSFAIRDHLGSPLLRVDEDGSIHAYQLPESDPGDLGALWVDTAAGNVIKQSRPG